MNSRYAVLVFATGLICGIAASIGIFRPWSIAAPKKSNSFYSRESGEFGLALKGNVEASSKILFDISQNCMALESERTDAKSCADRLKYAAIIDAENGGDGGKTALFQIYSSSDDCQEIYRSMFFYSTMSDELKKRFKYDYASLKRRLTSAAADKCK